MVRLILSKKVVGGHVLICHLEVLNMLLLVNGCSPRGDRGCGSLLYEIL